MTELAAAVAEQQGEKVTSGDHSLSHTLAPDETCSRIYFFDWYFSSADINIFHHFWESVLEYFLLRVFPLLLL